MLRTGTAEEIQAMFRRMSSERRGLIAKVVQLAYFMRGAIQYSDLMRLTYVERDEIDHFIEKRLESEGGRLYPQY